MIIGAYKPLLLGAFPRLVLVDLANLAPIRCLSRARFKQIRHAFTIRDPQLSPEQPGDPWWFRLEPLATTIQKSCQQYWAPGGHLAIDESMIPYFGHTWHLIKAPHKPISQGYKV
jgi:hypothetical protein